MKKFLIVVLSVMLVLSVAMVASAETNMDLYLDVIPAGTYGYETLVTGKLSAPLTGIAMGGDFVFDNIIAGVEFASLSSVETNDGMWILNATNETLLAFKGGYRVMASDQFTLDAIGYYSSLTQKIIKSGGKFVASGILIGAQGAYKISEQINVSGSYLFSVSASSKFNDVEYPGTTALSSLNLKGTYLLMENLGITAGYRSQSVALSFSGINEKLSFGGLTLGIVYSLQ